MAFKKKSETPSVKVVTDLLTDEQKQALRAKAKEHVNKKRTEAAEDQFLQAAIHQEELADKPLEQLEFILLDMAGHSSYIMIDGVQFFHGGTYEVTKAQADTMREVVARGWQHEHEVGGANRDQYRRPLNTTFSMKTGAVTNAPRGAAG